MVVWLKIATRSSDVKPAVVVETQGVELLVIEFIDNLYETTEVSIEQRFELGNAIVRPGKKVECAFKHGIVLSLGRIGLAKPVELTAENVVAQASGEVVRICLRPEEGGCPNEIEICHAMMPVVDSETQSPWCDSAEAKKTPG